MNSRLQALIDRGYQKEEVVRLSSFTEEELAESAGAAFSHISKNCTSVSKPEAIFVGGQPGSGKSTIALEIKNQNKNITEIGIDNYRMYHPNYLAIERLINSYWKDKEETIYDSPGNDMADFTQEFAGKMSDLLTIMGLKKNCNMLLEWSMREPNSPIDIMNKLKAAGYSITVIFVIKNKEESFKSCNVRSETFSKVNHIVRKVSKYFHDLCVQSLPESIDKIYITGKELNLFSRFVIINVDKEPLWIEETGNNPGEVIKHILNND